VPVGRPDDFIQNGGLIDGVVRIRGQDVRNDGDVRRSFGVLGRKAIQSSARKTRRGERGEYAQDKRERDSSESSSSELDK